MTRSAVSVTSILGSIDYQDIGEHSLIKEGQRRKEGARIDTARPFCVSVN